MRFILSVLCVLTVASKAQASEFFWQAESEKNYIIPQLKYESTKINDKVGGSVKTKGPDIDLGFERGLNEQMALGISTDFRFQEQQSGGTKIDYEGLGDFVVHFKAFTPISVGNFRYGADLSLSPGDSELKANEMNNYSGRHNLIPYVGIEATSGDLTFGGLLSYELALTDKKQKSGGTTDKYSGGDTLAISAFLESKTEVGHFGGALTYATTSDFKNKATGVKTEVSPIIELKAYGDRELNETTSLIFEASYRDLGSTEDNKDGSALGFIFGARLQI